MVRSLQVTSESLVNFPVDIEGIDFSGFGFPDLDGLAGFGEMDIGDFEFEQISRSDAIIDAEGKEEQITGLGGKELFNGLDVFKLADGLNEG